MQKKSKFNEFFIGKKEKIREKEGKMKEKLIYSFYNY
jgi:hypothetical protein